MPFRLLDADLLQSLEQIEPLSTKQRTGVSRRAWIGAGTGAVSLLPAEPNALPSVALGDNGRLDDTEAPLRLQRLFQRLFGSEQNLSIHLMIDATQSMSFTGSSALLSKFSYARKLAAALGYVALARFGRVGVCALGHSRGRRMPRLTRREQTPELFSYLEGLMPGGHRDFSRAVLTYAQRVGDASGICIILSDFLDPHWERAIRALFDRQLRVVLVQILDPEEAEPTILDDLRLVDSVSGTSRSVGATPQVVARYRAALDHFCGQLSDAATRQGMGYLRVTTKTPFASVLLQSLRTMGTLR